MASRRDAAELVRELGLQPHPEGGWYREIYRSPTRVETARGARSALTTIYYLLKSDQLSRWHVVQADELWHFYGGAPLELLAYTPTTRVFERRVLGPVAAVAAPGLPAAAASRVADTSAGTPEGDGAAGDVGSVATGAAASLSGAISARDVGSAAALPSSTVVSVIPTGVWQAARSLGDYTLVGCTVGPGFEFADFEFVSTLPSHAEHFSGELAAYSNLL